LQPDVTTTHFLFALRHCFADMFQRRSYEALPIERPTLIK